MILIQNDMLSETLLYFGIVPVSAVEYSTYRLAKVEVPSRRSPSGHCRKFWQKQRGEGLFPRSWTPRKLGPVDL